ncbi:MAG: histidine--tRNA ligase [Oscillospiraceae bacterium]|nr:histidine--tRNA ligase [Oscillospiraceae bacterium]
MELIAKRPNGTKDMIPAEAHKWHTVEKVVSETAECFGFKEIRFPMFEETGLFKRSVGDTTDVVQKEMYTVSSKGDDTFTLRPEGTAGTVRAVLQNGLLNEALPLKTYYIISCFRHEKAQKGRLREFHQFGVEMFGSKSYLADADVIALAQSVLLRLGIENTVLNINSIGCPHCREKYQAALREYFGKYTDKLCSTCLSRMEKNPMRILDCKSEICSDIAKDAPIILDFLCDECKEHFENLKENLTERGIAFKVNPKIVRGLDYYTKTVFEFVSDSIGAQGTICGGGRYDGLVEQLGGQPTPALGFAMGIERLLLTMEAENCEFNQPKTCDIYIAAMGKAAEKKTVSLVSALRDEGYHAESDVMGRGLKAQMKYADKMGAKFTLVLGDNELESGKAKLKNMKKGEETEISLGDKFIDDFSDAMIAEMFDVEEMFKG